MPRLVAWTAACINRSACVFDGLFRWPACCCVCGRWLWFRNVLRPCRSFGHDVKPEQLRSTSPEALALEVPSGFSVKIFAEDLAKPGMLDVANDGIYGRAVIRAMRCLSIAQFPQPERVPGCSAASVVVEVCVHRHPLVMETGAPFRPGFEGSVGVAPCITLRPVQA